jgi:hypothetical protein
VKLEQSTVTAAAGALLAVMTALLVTGVVLSAHAEAKLDRAKSARDTQLALAADMRGASTHLTDEVRAYSVTGEQAHLDAYWREVNVTKTRDHLVAKLRALGATARELDLINQAKANSDALIKTESRSMRLVLEAKGIAPARMPQAIAAVHLSRADSALTPPTSSPLPAGSSSTRPTRTTSRRSWRPPASSSRRSTRAPAPPSRAPRATATSRARS